MPFVAGNNYQGTFTGSVNVGDIVEYRIKATDNSNNHNIAYSPPSGYHSFSIVDVKGIVLVVDDDVTLLNRISTEKEYHEADASIPLGASATLFNTTLTTAGYLVEEITWAAFNPANLNNYDLVVLAAGLNEGTMFNDQTKRTAITNWTLAGGKTIVEGGEVGYQYRATSERDLQFRRNILNDSSWVGDNSGQNLILSTPIHPIFTTPNTITGPIIVNDGGSSGWGARDEVTLLNKAGVIRIANWSGGIANNPGIIVHNPNNSPDETRNIFFPFAVSAFANQTTAANLIENAVTYLLRDQVPTTKTLNLTVMIEGMWDGTTIVSDSVTVELRNTSAPFNLIESKKILLNSTGSGSLIFIQVADGTPYYLIIKHRNSIETWSSSTVQFIAGNLSYDFTNAQNKSYGNNLKLVNNKWCIYSGDVNQDGFIDITDQSQIFIDNISGAIGYISTDLNGDYFTEVGDLNLVFINRVLGISRQRPAGVQILINTID